ncbi:MAG: hypothetical protein R3A10_09445 [Caldilineaceae bacterium]
MEALRPVFWLLLLYRIIASAALLHSVRPARPALHGAVPLPAADLAVFVLVNNLIGDTLGLGDIPLFNLFSASITLRSFSHIQGDRALLLPGLRLDRRDSLSRALFSRRPDTDKGLANSVVVSTYYGIIALGILTAVSTIGFDLSTLTIVLGGLSRGHQLRLAGTGGQFHQRHPAGLRAVAAPRRCDQCAGHAGTVDKLRLRSTVLKTLDNVEMLVPNKTLLTSTVETYTTATAKCACPWMWG